MNNCLASAPILAYKKILGLCFEGQRLGTLLENKYIQNQEPALEPALEPAILKNRLSATTIFGHFSTVEKIASAK
jgi:hypothetical protein